jgi:Leucine-rich repeat (LRR) protein
MSEFNTEKWKTKNSLQQIDNNDDLLDNNEDIINVNLHECKLHKHTELNLSNLNLNDIPSELKNFIWLEKLIIKNNNLKYLMTYYLPPNLKYLDASNNYINEITGGKLPDTLENVNLSNNNIRNILGIFCKIKYLNLSNNYININSRFIPKSIITLDISRNNEFINDRFDIDSNLESLILDNTKIISITNLPNSITEISASRCELNVIMNIPSKLKKINISNNHLELFPDFPNSTEIININNNYIKNISYLPNILQFLDISNNKMLADDVDKLIKQHPYVNIISRSQNQPDNNTDYINLPSIIKTPQNLNRSRHISVSSNNRSRSNSSNDRSNFDIFKDYDRSRYNTSSSNRNNYYKSFDNNLNLLNNRMRYYNNTRRTISSSDFSKLNPHYIVHTEEYDI